MTTVINFFAGPGAGKSTTKAGTFFKMKLAGYKCEMVEEFAKELTYQENWDALKDQEFVSEEQEWRQNILEDHVDYILTDSPLILGCFYAQGKFDTQEFRDDLWKRFNGYDNINIWINRTKPYATYGRSQTEDEAKELDKKIFYAVKDILHLSVDGDERAPDQIIAYLKLRAKQEDDNVKAAEKCL
jgi:hypothetical protein